MILSASVLGADFGRLADHTRQVLDAGADWLHIDVMDGHFVPNISFGAPVMEGLRGLAEETETPLDVHLMIENPGRYLADFAKAGADLLTVHQEACPHLHRTVQEIHDLGCRAGVALNPATSPETLAEIAPDLDLVLVMSVNPGFAGQAFIASTPEKVRRTQLMLHEHGGAARIAVDGGVSPENASTLVESGADVLVAASAIFGGDVAGNVQAFRDALAQRV